MNSWNGTMNTAPSRVLHMRSSSQGVCGQLMEAKGRCSHANPMTLLKSHSGLLHSNWTPSAANLQVISVSAELTKQGSSFADDGQVYITVFAQY